MADVLWYILKEELSFFLTLWKHGVWCGRVSKGSRDIRPESRLLINVTLHKPLTFTESVSTFVCEDNIILPHIFITFVMFKSLQVYVCVFLGHCELSDERKMYLYSPFYNQGQGTQKTLNKVEN